MKLIAYCHGCAHQHPIDFDPNRPDNQINDWRYKHSHESCRVEFDWPGRSPKPSDVFSKIDHEGTVGDRIKSYLHNANIKLAWAASAAMTYTSLASLASSATWVAGASALAVDNTSNLYLDYKIAGLIKNGTTPTVSTLINGWFYCAYDDTPTYPDTLLGTDATKTITTVNILASLGRQAFSLVVAATTAQVNPFDAGFLSQYWGSIPKLWSMFIAHNCTAALASSGSSVSYAGQYATST